MNRPTASLAPVLRLGAFLVAMVLLGVPLGAAGSQFVVDSTADEIDAIPGDGVCASSSGGCTLRAAIMETNATPGPDTIALPAGVYTLAIPGAGEDLGATGDLDVLDGLDIVGSGPATLLGKGSR
jgi:CSLREA domain-containing protein